MASFKLFMYCRQNRCENMNRRFSISFFFIETYKRAIMEKRNRIFQNIVLHTEYVAGYGRIILKAVDRMEMKCRRLKLHHNSDWKWTCAYYDDDDIPIPAVVFYSTVNTGYSNKFYPPYSKKDGLPYLILYMWHCSHWSCRTYVF